MCKNNFPEVVNFTNTHSHISGQWEAQDENKRTVVVNFPGVLTTTYTPSNKVQLQLIQPIHL